MASIQQTKQLLQQLGVQPKRSLGQNFLVGDYVVTKIVEKVRSLSPAQVIEIGPGLGALTERLQQLECSFLVIELDRVFSHYWREKGVEVVEADALKVDWEHLALSDNTVLVSNLPYQISSRLVIDRSVGPKPISSMVLMFQKEVAQRIVASPKTKDYGFLSVIAQTFWKIELLLEAAPNEFYPAPKIASRVLTFHRKDLERLAEQQVLSFVEFVKAGFSQRRKRLVKNLMPVGASFGISSQGWVTLLANLGLGSDVRAEELSPQEFERLYAEMVK